MLRKILGVGTAVAAALVVVGVAWASGDDGDDGSTSASLATSASADLSSSVSAAADSAGASLEDRTSARLDSSTRAGLDSPISSASGSVDSETDVSSETDVRLVDTSSTSTTVDATTSTSLDDEATSSTSLTVDADSLLPITIGPKTYDVDGAGTVSIQVVAGNLILLDAGAASGWSLEVDKSDGRDIRVEFENGDSDARFEAKIRDGELRIEIERA